MYEDVIELARQAGNVLMKYYGKKVEVKYKDNDPLSPVCTADLEANDLILKGLEKYHYQILSEEMDPQGIDYSKPLWIIDPLDGTINFLRKDKGFSVMIALLVKGRLEFGVVYAPDYDAMYHAQRGSGAFLEKGSKSQKIHVSDHRILKDSSRMVPVHYKRSRIDDIFDSRCVKEIMGGGGNRMCLIAEGKAEFFVNTNTVLNKWDMAAPHIILEEAGGKITTFSGEPLDYSNDSFYMKGPCLASNSTLHEQVLKEIK